jgi:hypothetical protein
MAGALDQMAAGHVRAHHRLHVFELARRLIDSPVLPPGDEAGRHVDRAAACDLIYRGKIHLKYRGK